MKSFLFFCLTLLAVLTAPLADAQQPLRVGFIGDNRWTSTAARITGATPSTIRRSRSIGSNGRPVARHLSGFGAIAPNRGAPVILRTGRAPGELKRCFRRRPGHTGLAGQIAAGQASICVIVAIGGNDFAPWAGRSFPRFPAASLRCSAGCQDQRGNPISRPRWILVQAGRSSGRSDDRRRFRDVAPDRDRSTVQRCFTKRQRVSATVQRVNDGILRWPARGLAVMDLNAFGATVFAQVVNGFIVIDGVAINVNTAGDDPHNLILGDHIHGGTVLEGLIANAYIQQINTLVDPDIPVFSNVEILGHAGLAATRIDAQRDRDEHGQPDIYVVPDRDRYLRNTQCNPSETATATKRPLLHLWAVTDCDRSITPSPNPAATDTPTLEPTQTVSPTYALTPTYTLTSTFYADIDLYTNPNFHLRRPTRAPTFTVTPRPDATRTPTAIRTNAPPVAGMTHCRRRAIQPSR